MSQRVFIVVGAKGGVGATTVAIKLVEELPAAAERVIVDADLAGKRSLAIWYDLSVELDVGNLGQPLHQLVTDALVSLFNGHTHGGVAPGSGNSGVPNQQMGQGQLTQTLKGN